MTLNIWKQLAKSFRLLIFCVSVFENANHINDVIIYICAFYCLTFKMDASIVSCTLLCLKSWLVRFWIDHRHEYSRCKTTYYHKLCDYKNVQIVTANIIQSETQTQIHTSISLSFSLKWISTCTNVNGNENVPYIVPYCAVLLNTNRYVQFSIQSVHLT